MNSFGWKLVCGFQTVGRKLGVGSPDFGRKVVNSVKTMNDTLQQIASIVGGDNSGELAKFAGDFRDAKSWLKQLGTRNGIERLDSTQ